MENASVATRKKKALGDDPLSWLNESAVKEKKHVAKKTQPEEKVKQKKALSEGLDKVDKSKNKHSNSKIVLEIILVIDDAKKIHEELNSYISQKNDVIIDASSVQMIDTAMLQLLAAFVQKLKSQGTKVAWDKPSDEFVNRAVFLDLKEHLELPQ